MDESVFYDIQFDQKYDWEKDGNEVVEESEEMVEQEVDENSVEGVTNQERVSSQIPICLFFLCPISFSLFF